eukprot:gene27039-33262_t
MRLAYKLEKAAMQDGKLCNAPNGAHATAQETCGKALKVATLLRGGASRVATEDTTDLVQEPVELGYLKLLSAEDID